MLLENFPCPKALMLSATRGADGMRLHATISPRRHQKTKRKKQQLQLSLLVKTRPWRWRRLQPKRIPHHRKNPRKENALWQTRKMTQRCQSVWKKAEKDARALCRSTETKNEQALGCMHAKRVRATDLIAAVCCSYVLVVGRSVSCVFHRHVLSIPDL